MFPAFAFPQKKPKLFSRDYSIHSTDLALAKTAKAGRPHAFFGQDTHQIQRFPSAGKRLPLLIFRNRFASLHASRPRVEIIREIGEPGEASTMSVRVRLVFDHIHEAE